MSTDKTKPNLGRFGVFGRAVSADEAVAIEALGYGAVWVGGSPSASLEWAEPMLAATTTLQVASGIVNIWTGSAFLAPEHMVVLSGDAKHARSVARETLASYLGLKNAVTNFTRMGFTAADLIRPGSDRLVDAVVAHGTTDRIAAAVTRHLDAGADHVPLQVLTTPENLVPALTELARSLNQ